MQSSVLDPQKNELLIRIFLQNLVLITAVIAFCSLAVAALAWPARGWIVAFVHAVASGALLLQWCHHGVRTMQIKAFLLEREAQHPSSWEVWLPAHRPKRLLGTRWLISTKGVFLGTQAAMAGLAFATADGEPVWPQVACALAFGVSAGLLLTNPKE